jgi:hypothetical protein
VQLDVVRCGVGKQLRKTAGSGEISGDPADVVSRVSHSHFHSYRTVSSFSTLDLQYARPRKRATATLELDAALGKRSSQSGGVR